MYFLNVFKSTFRNLSLRKSRSFLTMLGIIIGVAAVISIIAVGASAQDLLLSQVSALGSNLISIMPGGGDESGPPAAVLGVEITTLTYEDALALGDLSSVEAICSYVKGRGTDVMSGKCRIGFTYKKLGVAEWTELWQTWND